MADTPLSRIAVIGGGAWGTALASVAARAGRKVTLWAREEEVVAAVNKGHENTPFLPGIALDPAIRATSDFAELAGAEAILHVAPAQHLRAVTAGLAPHLKSGTPLVLCAKGIETASGKLMSEVAGEEAPEARLAVLSGPSFAADVARGLPTAVTLACADEALGAQLVEAIGVPTFRPYLSTDVIGAQIGGAVKNVLAIACGIVEGKAFGDSARAALTARGFMEMSRFGEALGAKPATLKGLSGLGDLILTCGSRQSRNMSLGFALGEGKTLEDILGARSSVSEGVYTAEAVMRLAAAKGIDMPICEAVHNILSGKSGVDDAIAALLARPFTNED